MIDRRVGLDRVDQVVAAGQRGDRAPDRGDDADGERIGIPERAADRGHGLADDDTARVAERHRIEGVEGGIDADHADVVVEVVADDGRGHPVAVRELDVDRVRRRRLARATCGWPALVITWAFVRITPCGLTTNPEPWPALASGTLPELKYETIVTTPAERERKICAGANPLPVSGFATTTGAASPPRAGCVTTTVLVVVPPSQPAAFPTTSTAAPPITAATRARAAAELGRTGGPL